jgi:hypothetical protein
MSDASAPIDQPFRLINKQDCPEQLLDAYVFFETGGFVEVIRWEDLGTYWKVYTYSPDGGHDEGN